MITYEIKDDPRDMENDQDIDSIIRDYIKKASYARSTVDKGFLDTMSNSPTTEELNSILTNLNHELLNIHTVIEKNGDTKIKIIDDSVPLRKLDQIYFLAALIYKKFVEECLDILHRKTTKTGWNNIKEIVNKYLKLEIDGSFFKHFYTNPIPRGKGEDLKTILMYQLLQELIKNNMKPDINDVLDFLSKINASWCDDIDRDSVLTVLNTAKIQRPPSAIFTYFVDNAPARPLARLGASSPENPIYKLSVEYKKIDELQKYITQMNDEFLAKNQILAILLNENGLLKKIVDDIQAKKNLHVDNLDFYTGKINETVEDKDGNSISIYQIYKECELLLSKVTYLETVLISTNNEFNMLINEIKANITTFLQNSFLYIGHVNYINNVIQDIRGILLKSTDNFYKNLDTIVNPLNTKIRQLQSNDKISKRS